MTRRTLTIILHWTVFILMLAMIKGGTAHPAVRLAFVASGGLWVCLAVVRGIMAKPGLKLSGPLRSLFAPMHWAMYGLVCLAVVLNATAFLALTPLDWAWNALLAMLVASTFHAIVHLWRHTTLNDGALRMIFPKGWHKYL